MEFLRKSDLLLIHRAALARFGGASGLRDDAALESAMIAAENRAWYEGAGIVECAAAYAYHLVRAHAFVDGNKRVAAAGTELFLALNESSLDASNDEVADFFLALAAGAIDRAGAEAWLRLRIRAR